MEWLSESSNLQSVKTWVSGSGSQQPRTAATQLSLLQTDDGGAWAQEFRSGLMAGELRGLLEVECWDFHDTLLSEVNEGQRRTEEL